MFLVTMSEGKVHLQSTIYVPPPVTFIYSSVARTSHVKKTLKPRRPGNNQQRGEVEGGGGR